jgi:TonB family protein
MHEQLKQVLMTEALGGRRVLVFIDEAQNLTERVLETVRLLSDFETPRSKLMQIILCGQPQLADKLACPTLDQLRQRVSILGGLDPLTPSETDDYIAHRLRVAGYEGDRLFTPEACKLIAARSGGVPRNINNLCFNALSLGYALGRTEIQSSLVREVSRDLEMNRLISNHYDSNGSDRPVAAASQDVPIHLTLCESNGKNEIGTVPRTIALAASLALMGWNFFVSKPSGDLMPPPVRVVEAEHNKSDPLHNRHQPRINGIQPAQELARPSLEIVPKSLATDVAHRYERKTHENPVTSTAGTGSTEASKTSLLPSSSITNPRSVPMDEGLRNETVPIDVNIPPAYSIVASGLNSATPSPRAPNSPQQEKRLVPAYLIYQVQPLYPHDAEKQRIEGTVNLRGFVGPDGRVRKVEFVSGPTLLVPAALSAAREWRYIPAMANGQPIESEEDIRVDFHLLRRFN